MAMLLTPVLAKKLVDLEALLSTNLTFVVVRIWVVRAEVPMLLHVGLVFERFGAIWSKRASMKDLWAMLNLQVPLLGLLAGEGGITLITSQFTFLPVCQHMGGHSLFG